MWQGMEEEGDEEAKEMEVERGCPREQRGREVTGRWEKEWVGGGMG